MSATDTMISTALDHAREAIDEALDALEAIERPDSDYVLPLIEAQKNVALTIRHYNRLARDDA